MITLWYTMIKLGKNELEEVPERYYAQVLERLVAEGYYNEDGTRIEVTPGE